MKNFIDIFGAGGHTRSLLGLLNDQDLTVSGIYDESYNSKEKEVINTIELKGNLLDYDCKNELIISSGDNTKRKAFYLKYLEYVYKKSICHSKSFVESSVVLGNSNFIFAGCIINANVKIGDNNIINTGSIIEHETKIGSHNHISVGSILCGRVSIENNCFIGAGAVINDKVSICSNVTIGSNSVVINSITEPGTYVGNPVRKVDKKK